MPDIYGRVTDSFGGSFAADQATITFPAIINAVGRAIGADVGLLLQRMAMTYSQEVARLYEVGRPVIYYIGGRTSGAIGMDRVIGPRSIAQEFYRTYGDICRARSNSLQFEVTQGCGESGTPSAVTGTNQGYVSYQCHFCVITTISANIRSQDMIINEGLQLMFSSLLYNSVAGESLAGAAGAAAADTITDAVAA
jgi:hypothetical protein